MRGLDPRIHVLRVERLQKTWMAGTSPAMTEEKPKQAVRKIL
jgi:hypothetical protein